MKKLISAILLLGYAAVSLGDVNFHSVIARKKDSVSYTVVAQLDTTQDSGGTSRSDIVATFDATNETYSSGSDHSSEITVTKVEVQLEAFGSPTGALTCYLYEPATPSNEGVPDDRVGTADATLDVSTITSKTWYEFTFSPGVTLTAGNHLEVVLTLSDGTGVDASNYIEWSGDDFLAGSWSQDSRTTGAPAATNDAANWTTDDANGCYFIKVYESP